MPPAHTIIGATLGNGRLQIDQKGRVYFENYERIFRIEKDGELKQLWKNTSSPTLRISAFLIDLKALSFKSYGYQAGFVAEILEHAGLKQGAILKPQTYIEASFTFRNARDTKRNLFFTYNLLGKYQIYQLNEQSLCSFTHVPINATYTAILTMPNNTIWIFDQAAMAWYCWKLTSAVPEKLLLDKESMKTEEVTDAKFLGRLYLANYRLPWFVTI